LVKLVFDRPTDQLKREWCRVHIVAQPANWYIMAFHIAISNGIYSHTRWRQSRDADGGSASIYWSDGSDVCIHLQTQIRRLFRINGLM